MLMGLHWILGFFGSASFGRTVESRIRSRIGAAFMVIFLSIEYWLFQFLARPTLRWSIVGALLAVVVLWSFIMTAFTDPGTPSCAEWREWYLKYGMKERLKNAELEDQPKE